MEFIYRNRKPLLIIVLGITALFAFFVGRVRISFSFEDFYPKSDPEYRYYKAFGETFGEEQNHLITIAFKAPGKDIFDDQFLRKADSLFAAIGELPGMDSMVVATRFPQVRRSGLGVRSKPYLRFEDQEAVRKSMDRVSEDPLMLGTFITDDFEYLCGYYFIAPQVFDTKGRDEISDGIDAILQSTELEHIVSGIPYIRTGYVRTIANELLFFISLSMVLLVMVLFLMYRNFWGVLIPMSAVLVGLIWTLGAMGMAGQPINLLTNLLMPIIFVVGTSDVIHLTTKYLNGLRNGKAPGPAMRQTLREIGIATLLTSITTAIGFISLLVSRVPPIRHFGLFAAMGVVFAYIISITIIPNALIKVNPESFLKRKSVENHASWDRFFLRIYRITSRNAGMVLGISALVIGACIYLITQIPINTYLLEDIRDGDPIKTSMQFFEKKLEGHRPFEMAIEVQEGHKVSDREVLLAIADIQDKLAEDPVFGEFLSPVSFIRNANFIYRYNRPDERRIPDTQEEIDELLAFAELSAGGELLDKVMDREQNLARLSARIPDIGTDSAEIIYARLKEYTDQAVDPGLIQYRYTGHAYLTEQNLKYLRSSLLTGLLLAFGVIGLIMGLLFRSWRMLFISMIPNMIPLLLTGGVMGLFGITLTTSTAVVFVIAFGIAVDDTIHFLTRFRIEIGLGRTVDVAIRNTLLGTGKAIMITTLILLGGFVLLLSSSFGGTFATGLYTALTLVFALLADLLLLPVLLKYLYKAPK